MLWARGLPRKVVLLELSSLLKKRRNCPLNISVIFTVLFHSFIHSIACYEGLLCTSTFLGLKDSDMNKIGSNPVPLEPTFLSRVCPEAHYKVTDTGVHVCEMLCLTMNTNTLPCVFTMVMFCSSTEFSPVAMY